MHGDACRNDTMVRLEKITRAGYQVEIWEYEFDEGILPNHPELQTQTLVEQSTKHSRPFMGDELRP
jgi:hypothetical protein